jgi:hypothetical protein
MINNLDQMTKCIFHINQRLIRGYVKKIETFREKKLELFKLWRSYRLINKLTDIFKELFEI